MVDSKKVREGSTKLQKEMKRISAEQARIQQNGLSFILEAQLTESQMVEIKEIVSGEKPTDSESCNSSEMRELKRKLADKSEQLRMLQGSCSFLSPNSFYLFRSFYLVLSYFMCQCILCLFSFNRFPSLFHSKFLKTSALI